MRQTILKFNKNPSIEACLSTYFTHVTIKYLLITDLLRMILRSHQNSFLISLYFAMMCLGLILLPPVISTSNLDQNALAQTSSSAASLAQDQRPNVLLIVADDLGFSDIGSFGSEISTPNLDQIASEGKILTNYHTASTCSPARAAMLTGVDWHIGGIGTMYEFMAENQKGKPGYETYLNNRVVTVAELLRDAGYNTLMSGKWHLSGHGTEHPGSNPYSRGFDHVFSLLGDGGNHWNSGPIFPGLGSAYVENNTAVNRPGNNTLYSTDLFTDELINLVNNTRGNGNPLFMYLAPIAPHSAFMAPYDNVEKYEKIYSVGWESLREQRFEKQKELGIWDANMTSPKRLPPNQPWDSLTQEQKDYASRILAVRAGMIENLDQNVGRLIQYLKQVGEYDNTLIMFTSDNVGSEAVQFPIGGAIANSVDKKALPAFFKTINNTLPNLGNSTSSINYGTWGSYLSVAPLSGYKASTYEGGTRAPFIVKEPASMVSSTTASSSGNNSSTTPKIINRFAFVTDLTPTILDFAKVPQPPAGSVFRGNETYPIMGKSIKPVLNGLEDRVHAVDEPIGTELFNSSSVYMGDWVAVWDGAHPTGKWQLYDFVNDPAQNVDVADQHPELVQKMTAAYQNYSKQVGIVIPRGELYAFQISKITPAMNQTQTIDVDQILPEVALEKAKRIKDQIALGI
jgi:arylsulfatase A-like enzyme